MNEPNNLLDNIWKENNSIYTKLTLDYTNGLNKIYNNEEVEQARRSPSFEREMECKFLGSIRNAFNPSKVDSCCIIGNISNNDLLKDVDISVGVDPAFSFDGSKFAIVCVAVIDGKVHVTDAIAYQGLEFSASLEKLFNLLSSRYDWFRGSNRIRIYADSSFPAFIRAAALYAGDNENYEFQMDYCRKNKIPLENIMRVIPVSFAIEGVRMLSNLQTLISDNLIRIPSDFTDLISNLRTARVKNNGNLDKLQSVCSNTYDLLDALRLAAISIKRG